MESEIAELMVETQPLVAAVSIADNLTLGIVDMPLRHTADLVTGGNRNPRPDFMLRIIMLYREKISRLGDCTPCTRKSHQDGEDEPYCPAKKYIPAKVQVHSLFLHEYSVSPRDTFRAPSMRTHRIPQLHLNCTRRTMATPRYVPF